MEGALVPVAEHLEIMHLQAIPPSEVPELLPRARVARMVALHLQHLWHRLPHRGFPPLARAFGGEETGVSVSVRGTDYHPRPEFCQPRIYHERGVATWANFKIRASTVASAAYL